MRFSMPKEWKDEFEKIEPYIVFDGATPKISENAPPGTNEKYKKLVEERNKTKQIILGYV